MNKLFQITFFLSLIVVLYSCKSNIISEEELLTMEKNYDERKSEINSFTNWIDSAYSSNETMFIHTEDLPNDKRQQASLIGISNILLNVDNTINYQLDWKTESESNNNRYIYLSKCKVLNKEKEQNISTNGLYVKLDANWYLIVKNYDWFFE